MAGSSALEDGAAAQFDIKRSAAAMAGCPVSGAAAEYTPFDRPFIDDPYPFFARVQKEEPVFYSPEIDYWVVTRYEDVRDIFRDPATWSAAITLSAVTPMSPQVLQRLRESGFRMNPVLTNLDPPQHARIRKHATNAFSTKRVAAAEPWIRRLADDFIDRLLAKPVDPDGHRHADMVSEFAYDLPAHVGMRFVGIPDDRVPDVKAWTANRVSLTWGRCTEEEQLDEVEGLIAMWKFCEDHVAAMMEKDEDSFLGHLVSCHRANPQDLTINEIESMLFTMIVAGHETTSNVMASALLTLLQDRHLWERLVADPSIIPQAVEEMLRYRPSVISWRRVATRETQLDGHTIPEGARILLMIAAANHDPTQFPEPEKVDLCRANASRHFAFGHGVHLCVGAGLARLELKVFLEQLVARMPGMKLDPSQTFAYPSSLSFRGPIRLSVHW
ncbi:cytochrome P450 [Novosphingobium mangrovi (ex Hu et al. 2023)]|uniref:Cytochrome P450 n=1 Tax=Novosphingobium mangrovi (ex Hu et al. 2023) TaxID=2930094 RepID=A0ABT0ADX6_9SPHN|nr:cytochrome P450 [Novosphingobium mangrovi (ex Hu et al. 2023)]MCJ1961405.1 cytochrome P450 [Novosphingobium mangrovi (ex Hu et al. 2023)]